MRIARAAKDHPQGLSLSCSQAGAGDHEITCLAHTDEETLAAAAVYSGEVTLLRGDCATCPLAIRAPGANGVLEDVDDPLAMVEKTVEDANALLARSDLEAHVAIEEHAPDPDEEPKDQGGVSRRDLFRVVKPADPDEDGDLRVPAPTDSRGVLLAALPGAIVDHPVAEPGCTGCRVCEQVCPENAFQWSGVGNNGMLWVSPADCIACGLCVQACPEDVLSLEPVTPADGAHRIARIQPRGCSRCGRGLQPGEEDVCTPCTSRRSLLDDVWKQLG